MERLFIASLLMIFLIWAHRALTRNYSSPNHQNVTTNDWSAQKILITTLLYLGCYLLVSLAIWSHNKHQQMYYNKFLLAQKEFVENTENKNFNNQKNNDFFDFLTADQVKTRFTDVAGMQEAKEEINDIIDFLKNPKKYSRLGAKTPKGLIMYGPPGTGKTLLARAMAGEAQVPFISVSGSQFEEEYIGVGAARVRQLFTLARKHAPCIIFIDEIDTVAFKRNSGKNQPWLAQTINQLLSEMDGLNDTRNSGIMVIAASNRMEVLDPAILRPGRFDRHVKLDLPTLQERKAILAIHLRNVKIDEKVNIETLAKMTTGSSGADLASIVNEAAIDATKKNKPFVDMPSFEMAKDRMMLGNKRQSIQMSDAEKKVTAYHESGHALVSLFLSAHDPIYKITITPRGMSLGHTAYQPQADKYSYSKQYIEHTIASALGGRVAEELLFEDKGITTGAENDFKVATELAYKMVTQWGFSKRLGILNDPDMNFIDKEVIEKEVQEILNRNYQLAKDILIKNKAKLVDLSNALLEHETLDAEEIRKIAGNVQKIQ